MWCLGRFLPILIGDIIPNDNPYWENFLTHLTIINEAFAPVSSEERLDYLGMLIEDFLEEFVVLYKDRPLTPKMHYLLHIPTWIRWYCMLNAMESSYPLYLSFPNRCGPLIRIWCMRYEAKHSFFKHLSNILRNFCNIPKTLAARHQHYMCYQMLNGSTYLRHTPTFTGGMTLM